jgi:hypothetical protein
MKTKPTIQRLREVLVADAETGIVRWRVSRGTQAAGAEAGSQSKTDGYVRLKVDGVCCLRHHVVWALVVGRWPVGELDHKNRTPGNDWLDNLRPATRSQQLANARGRSATAKGVRCARGRWTARIKVEGVATHLGSFDTEAMARAAYAQAAVQHFGEYARP